MNWEMVFASADPLERTVPVRGGARPPCCWDPYVCPECVFFLGQPHCPENVFQSGPGRGPHKDTLTRSRFPPLPPSCPGKATRTFLPRPKVIPSPSPQVTPSPPSQGHSFPRPKNQLHSHHPKMQLMKKEIVEEGIDKVGCYSG